MIRQVLSNSQLDVVRLRGQLIIVLAIMGGICQDVLVLFFHRQRMSAGRISMYVHGMTF